MCIPKGNSTACPLYGPLANNVISFTTHQSAHRKKQGGGGREKAKHQGLEVHLGFLQLSHISKWQTRSNKVFGFRYNINVKFERTWLEI